MKFGEFLKQERDAKDWKQPEAAKAIGIEQSYLSKLENDKAIPSAEVFDQLLEAYGFDLAKLGENLSETELDKFKEIVIVRDFIMKARHQSVEDRRKWLIRGLASITVGIGLLSLTFLPKSHEVVSYTYESKGVIMKGESRFIFAEMPDYGLYLRTLKNHTPTKCAGQTLQPSSGSFSCSSRSERLKRFKLFPRLDYKIKKLLRYNGEFFDSTDEGEDRRYFLVDEEYSHNKGPDPFWTMVGAMLSVFGLASFFISRRW